MFTDNDFPNIVFTFEDAHCPQVSILELTVPPQVPNGDAIIFWYQPCLFELPVSVELTYIGNVLDNRYNPASKLT
jgi:hypothetical protein